MKYLIVLLFIIDLSFAYNNDNMTDVETAESYKKQVWDMQTADYQCNLYIEKTGANLYHMSLAEQENDKKKISKEFFVFMKNSRYAMEYCKYISDEIVTDMRDIREGVSFYYENEIRGKK